MRQMVKPILGRQGGKKGAFWVLRSSNVMQTGCVGGCRFPHPCHALSGTLLPLFLKCLAALLSTYT